MTNKERDTLLIRLDERQETIETKIDNHLAHHFRANILLAGTALSTIISLILVILTAIISQF